MNNDVQLERNHLWMPPELIAAIADFKVTIIGCGGTGSLFAVYAAHLGFYNICLCDTDVLETSNFNRFLFGDPEQLGRSKVEIVSEYLHSRLPRAKVESILHSFPNDDITNAISGSEIVISCVDDVHTRIEVDTFCRSARKTVIDLGTGFALTEDGGSIESAGGQVLVSRPDGACLMCLGFSMPLLQHNYYLPGSGNPEPSSLLLNSVTAGLAVELLLNEIQKSDEERVVNRVNYDRGMFRIEKDAISPTSECALCGINSKDNLSQLGRYE